MHENSTTRPILTTKEVCERAKDLKCLVRRAELRRIVPLSDTTIYEMEQRGDFPRRFYLTARCAAWDLGEVEAWIKERRRVATAKPVNANFPDVHKRKARPVKR